MEHELDEEIVIDFKKILKTLKKRIVTIISVFVLVLILFISVTFILPKKYIVNSDIYVNKSNNTNLADVNPFIISEQGGSGLSGMLSGTSADLTNELEIIQSPLVMDPVIKENNIRYLKGKKKGELVSTEDFLRKNISIENKKGTKVITISYTSKDPLLAYNIINSIINNYQLINEKINTKKASGDKKLLQESLTDTNKELNQKLAAMKNTGAVPISGIGQIAVMRGYNKAIGGAINTLANQAVEGQKRQIAVDTEVEKLKMIKSKLEWSALVEEMSKNATNVIVLKQPQLKKDFQYSQPKLFNNILLGIIFGVISALLALIIAEISDKKLTYSSMGDKIIYDPDKNPEELKILLLANKEKVFTILTLPGIKETDFASLSAFSNFKVINADINPQTAEEIKKCDKLIIAGKIGRSPKKLYQQIKTICEQMNKKICLEIAT